jgi:hypothetical protein
MTEHEWDSCHDLRKMLKVLRKRGILSERKARLFAVACCRRIAVLPDAETEVAVEVAERYCDGRATDEMLAAARGTLHRLYRMVPAPAYAAAYHACFGSPSSGADAAQAAANAGVRNLTPPSRDRQRAAQISDEEDERRAQAALLRDVIGNPFRAMTIAPSLLTWDDGAVLKLAQAIYEGRTFERMPELADALERAGCREPEVLAHCRQQGQAHVKGCWVLDLLLGKE